MKQNVYTVELPQLINPKQNRISIVGSSNGLLCLLYEIRVDDIFIIWNPSTRKHIKLPKPSTIKSSLLEDEEHILGYRFGYDYVSDHYKVVMLFQYLDIEDDESFLLETNVFSLKWNSWRKFEHVLDYLISEEGRRGALACGAIHWVEEKSALGFSPCLAVAFDLATEEYKIVTLPDLSTEPFSNDLVGGANILEFCGFLSIVCYYFNTGGGYDVWVMKDYGIRESWTKLLTLLSLEIIRCLGTAGCWKYDMIPLVYLESGDEVLMMLNYEKIIRYNLENKTFKVVDVHGLPRSFGTIMCLEILVSLDGKVEK